MSNYDGQVFEFKAIPLAEKFYSDNSVWGCYAFYTLQEIPEAKQVEHSNFPDDGYTLIYQSSLVGKMQRLDIGTEYTVKARISYHPKYKYSYEVISIDNKVPKTFEEQKKFIQSIVTEKQAETLLGVYPNIVEDVVNGTDNVDLNLTKGIKEFTWERIKGKIVENYAISDILSLLIPLGVSYNKVKKLLDNEPNPNILRQRLLDDPYVIVEIPTISFKQADNIALKLNPNFLRSNQRTIAFLKHHFKETGETFGNTWISIDSLDTAVKENIIECYDVFKELIEREKEFPTFFYIQDNMIGSKYYRFVEEKIWEFVQQCTKEMPLEISYEDITKGIDLAEARQGFLFTEEQFNILVESTKNNFVIITGKAGTGKTTIARGLLTIYKDKSIGACALSAKAAKRIEEVTGFQAMTIHRLLGATGTERFMYNENNPLPYDVIFVDEASMIYSGLFYHLFRAIKPNTKVILCGDSKQLPPIGFGNTFCDLLEKKNLHINYLTKILRQAEDSGIITDANKIREGENPITKFSMRVESGNNKDMLYIFRDSRDSLNEIAIKTYMKAIEKDGIDNVYILVPRRKDCINSTRELNRVIQDLLIDSGSKSMRYGDTVFRKGAKVIHVVNNYKKNIFNGDMGTVIDIGIEDGEERLIVDYPDRGYIEYYRDELNELDLAYALTVHKFQGSEASSIICIIDNTHRMLLDSTFLYTALTRAKNRCLLLAETYAFKDCIVNNKSKNRQTWTKFFE